MRATAVSFEDVRNAFFEVLAEGGNPTFEAIYTKIGRRGGADVVRKLITEVKTEAANLHEKLTLSRMPGVPDPLVDLLNEFARTSWDLALDGATKNLEAARADLERKEDALEEENKALRATADDFVQKALLLQKELAGLERMCAERTERIQALTEEVQHLTERNDNLHAEIAHYQRRIGELEGSVQAERERGDRLLASATERHEVALASLTERHQALVAELRAEAERQMKLADDRADGDRKHLLKQTDDLRQEFVRKESALKQAIESAQMNEKKAWEELRMSRKENATLREQLAEANGKIAALSSIETLFASLKAAENTPKRKEQD